MQTRMTTAAKKMAKLAGLVGGALMLMAPTEELDGNYNFALQIEGISGDGKTIIGGFKTLSGMDSETEVIEFRDGGDIGAIRKLPGRTKFSNLVLKRGFAKNSELWRWYQDVRSGGPFARRRGAVVLVDRNGREQWRYDFTGAFPVQWQGPTVDASKNEVAIETLELAIESADMPPRKPNAQPKRARVRIDFGGEVAFFRSVGGLKMETEVVEHAGGGGGAGIKVPGATRFGNILLRRAIGDGPDLWAWRRSAINGAPLRRSGSIVILDNDGETEVARYNFHDAWPCKWKHIDLDSSKNDGLIEEIEIAIERLERG